MDTLVIARTAGKKHKQRYIQVTRHLTLDQREKTVYCCKLCLLQIYEVCCGHRFTHDTLRLTAHAVCVHFSPSFVFPMLCGHSTDEYKGPFTNMFFFSIIFRLFCCCCFCLCLSIFSFRNANVVLKIQKSSEINYALVFFFTFNRTATVDQKPKFLMRAIIKKKYVSWSRVFFKQNNRFNTKILFQRNTNNTKRLDF